MPRKKANIHYLYKTTCLITGRYYIGMHSTSNLEDGYMGSGRRLRYSLRKHGIDNHKKEILEFFETRELLIEAEKKAITPKMITDNNCMNLAEGGIGGHGSRFLTKKQLVKGRQKCNEILKEKYGDNYLQKISLDYHNSLSEDDKIKFKQKISERLKEINFNHKNFEGKKHSEITKQKMSESSKGIGIGETNSQYGTCWITKDGINKKIKKEDLDTFIQDGWIKGRKM